MADATQVILTGGPDGTDRPFFQANLVFATQDIIAADIDINSGRNFVLNVPDADGDGIPDTIFHTAGSPVAAFRA